MAEIDRFVADNMMFIMIKELFIKKFGQERYDKLKEAIEK